MAGFVAERRGSHIEGMQLMRTRSAGLQLFDDVLALCVQFPCLIRGGSGLVQLNVSISEYPRTKRFMEDPSPGLDILPVCITRQWGTQTTTTSEVRRS